MNCLSNYENLKEVSIIKFVNPGEVILDVLPEDRDLEEELVFSEDFQELLSGYFRNRDRETIEGREFHIGETVAVHLNSSWRPAICTDISFVKGGIVYEVLMMDSGQIIEVDFLTFRPLPFLPSKPSRFNSFVLLDILPIGMKNRGICSWETDADEDIRLLMELASKVFVVIAARFPLPGYERLFGDMYLQVSNQLIDLKKHLVENKWAFEDSHLFERVYQLSDEHFSDGKRERPCVMDDSAAFESSIRILSPVEPEEITDETLDNHLPDYWKTGGSDPLTQVDRENIRRRIMSEARIGFGVALQGYRRVQAEEKLIKKMKECPANLDDIVCGGHQSVENAETHDRSYFESDGGTSSLSEESFREQTKESEAEHSGNFSESEQSTFSPKSVCAESEPNLTEKRWHERNEMYKKFGGENTRFKQSMESSSFLNHATSSNSERCVPHEISQKIRDSFISDIKNVSQAPDPHKSGSVLNGCTSPQTVPSSNSNAHSNISLRDREDSILQNPIQSSRDTKTDLSDSTRQKVLALFNRR